MSTTNRGMETVPTGTFEPSVPVNADLVILDAAVYGSGSIEFTTDANRTLTATECDTSLMVATDSPSTLTAGRDLIFPAHFPLMHFKNSTAQTLTLKKSGQTGISVVAGGDCMIASGVTDVVKASLGGSSGITSVNGDTGVVLVPTPFGVACSDLTTDLTTGTTKGYFRAPFAMENLTYRASLVDPSSSGIVTVDINKNGSTILSTKLTIDATEKTSTTAATAYVATSTTCADDDEYTIDIDGAGADAKGLIVWFIGNKT